MLHNKIEIKCMITPKGFIGNRVEIMPIGLNCKLLLLADWKPIIVNAERRKGIQNTIKPQRNFSLFSNF